MMAFTYKVASTPRLYFQIRNLHDLSPET